MSDAPRRLLWLSEQLTPRSGARVLEVGCGSGYLLELLARRHPGLALVGIDRSPLQVTMARHRLASLPDPPTVLAVALEDVAAQLAGVRFTHIVAMNVNVVWTNPAAAGDALRPLLAPRGKVLLGFEPPTPAGRKRLHERLASAAAVAGFELHDTRLDPESAAFAVEWRRQPRVSPSRR